MKLSVLLYPEGDMGVLVCHAYMSETELNQKLQELREQYKKASPNHRKLIEMRASLLKKRFEEQKNERAEQEASFEFAHKLFGS